MPTAKHSAHPNPLESFWRTITPKQFFAASVVILALALVMLTAALYVQHRTPQHILVDTPAAGHGVGQSVTQGQVTMRISKITKGGAQPGFAVPGDKQYLVVDMHITNNVDHPLNILPSADTYLKDDAGNVSYLTPYGLKNPFHAGTLLPGETVRGELSYMAPKSGHIKLYVDGIWSGGVVPFEVQ